MENVFGWRKESNGKFVCSSCFVAENTIEGYMPIKDNDLEENVYSCTECGKVVCVEDTEKRFNFDFGTFLKYLFVIVIIFGIWIAMNHTGSEDIIAAVGLFFIFIGLVFLIPLMIAGSAVKLISKKKPNSVFASEVHIPSKIKIILAVLTIAVLLYKLFADLSRIYK
jgi:hypothetical protein